VAELLEIGAHSVTAILATWIGLLVVTRAGRARGAWVFAFLCVLLVIWSVAIIIQRLTVDPTGQITPAVNLWEDVAAWLLPAATVHVALAVAFEGRWSRLANAVLVTAYGVGLFGIAQAAIDPVHPIAFDEPNWEPLGFDGLAVAWAFSAIRLSVWLAAVAYLLVGLREAGGDRVRRRQLVVALLTVVIGVIGGMLRILPSEIGGPRWVGVSLVALAVILATYAVLAQHVFLAVHVATRAVVRSLLAGLAVVAYVGIVALVDATATRALAVEIPLVTAFALVVTVAVFEPAAAWARERLAGGGGDRDELRLLAALGVDPVLAQSPDQALVPVLERLARTFDLEGAAVVAVDGTPVAATGTVGDGLSGDLRLPLTDADGTFGYVIFASETERRSFTPTEMHALRLAATYLGSSVRLAERQDVQASALALLAGERASVLSQGEELTDALAQVRGASAGLHVFALGPLRAERNGEPVRRWGGEKAGSRQAEAIFAMLFDRGERGAAKDEILEIIWPDVDLDRADVAFHRTMLGLRSTLGGRRRGRHDPVDLHNDRYRLDPAVVTWSDVAEFERLLLEARTATDEEGLRTLEQTRALYRGDYMDDVPYFGDSAAVEDRRGALRRNMHAVLLELATQYDARGDRLASSAARREAEALAAEIDDADADAMPMVDVARAPAANAGQSVVGENAAFSMYINTFGVSFAYKM